MGKFEMAANLAFFLLEKTGSVCGQWTGRLKAQEQRDLFGTFLGKGRLVIDGATESVQHIVKVCFGMDYDVTFAGGLDKLSAHCPATYPRKLT